MEIRKHLDLDRPAAILRFSFVVTAILYNYTEASFYGLNNIWVLTLFAVISVPGQAGQKSEVTMPASKYQALYYQPGKNYAKS